MNTPLTVLAIILFASTGSVQAVELIHAERVDQLSFNDPTEAAHSFDDSWIGFSLPALEGTQSPCCWKGEWNGHGDVGCKLQKPYQSYGTRSDSPPTSHLFAFARYSDGHLQSLQLVGEQCPVDAGGETIHWIGSVQTRAGLDWLENVARSSHDDSVRDAALFAMALHAAPESGSRLYALAGEPQKDLARDAIFWLGESRGKEGFRLLSRLLEELPEGDTRQGINFALAQNGSKESVDLLVRISQGDPDPEQRTDALFWLSQEVPETAQAVLIDILSSKTDPEILEQAVFAVSQLPSETATQMLMSLARDGEMPREVRKQALFWLANSDDEAAVDRLVELLIQY